VVQKLTCHIIGCIFSFARSAIIGYPTSNTYRPLMEVQGVRKAHKKGNIESNESATQIRLVSWTDFDNSGLWSCWIATSASALPETTQHHHSSLSQLFSKHPQLISILFFSLDAWGLRCLSCRVFPSNHSPWLSRIFPRSTPPLSPFSTRHLNWCLATTAAKTLRSVLSGWLSEILDRRVSKKPLQSH